MVPADKIAASKSNRSAYFEAEPFSLSITATRPFSAAARATAILSAVIFNALILVALIPLALRGVAYRPVGAGVLLRHNLMVYGLGGLLTPFLGIKLVDLVVQALRLA